MWFLIIVFGMWGRLTFTGVSEKQIISILNYPECRDHTFLKNFGKFLLGYTALCPPPKATIFKGRYENRKSHKTCFVFD